MCTEETDPQIVKDRATAVIAVNSEFDMKKFRDEQVDM